MSYMLKKVFYSYPKPLWFFQKTHWFHSTHSSSGYDKLKPYGFPIHGCICWYSRRIPWLEVVKSNNDPSVPAKLYLDTVQSLKGCPRIVRSDCGTKNVTLAAIQCSLRATDQDEYAAEKAHRYGSSPANQWIEGYVRVWVTQFGWHFSLGMFLVFLCQSNPGWAW